MDPLLQLEDELRKCVRCGACRAHCPVFSELGREPTVARGKVALAQHLLQHDILLDDFTAKIMSHCLLCGNCVLNCPNDVPTDEIIIRIRTALAVKRGLPPFHKAVATVLRSGEWMKWGAIAASLVAPLLFRKIPATSGLRLRLALPFLGSRRHIPAISRKPFLHRHPELIPGKPGRPRIVYFVGCMSNFIYPEVGEATLALFQSLGCTLYIPRGQQCCGLPALSGGDIHTVHQLATRNLAEIGSFQADYIVTACATCGTALQKYYPSLVGRSFPELIPSANAVAKKTMDAVQLLAGLGFQPASSREGQLLSITYHDPCHLRARGIIREPRELLKRLPGIRLVEMEGADKCCGLGGTFNIYHYETSMGINKGKTSAILDTQTETVVTGCPGCMMQLSDGLKQQGSAIRVRHSLEILARNCR